MRVLLVTGKGGVGKTTVAAATALRASEMGHRTLVVSTDPAHSLADAFDTKLDNEVVEVADLLHGQQIDGQEQLAKHWGDIHDQLMSVFDWGGVRGVEAEEFLVFPGMDELFSLLEVKNHARSGEYDAIIVDCAPTAETLRLLSLPEVLSWYFDRVLPTERRLMRAARPVLSKVTNLPMPADGVYDAAERVFTGLAEVRVLLGDTSVTSARLVVNPEKMVVAEARRTYTYLSLFGYAVDGVVVNRILPAEVTSPYFSEWRKVQRRHLDHIKESFAEVEVLTLRLFDEEMIGTDRLRRLGKELYGARDPMTDFEAGPPFTVYDQEDKVVWEMSVPFVSKEDLEVVRRGEELFVTVGAYKRSFVLPDSLRRRVVSGAKLEGGRLRVSFEREHHDVG